jgi:hypothetical protein
MFALSLKRARAFRVGHDWLSVTVKREKVV